MIGRAESTSVGHHRTKLDQTAAEDANPNKDILSAQVICKV
jgi:hypothetical protein